jgi:DNA methylase/ParB-like nuclease domain
VPKSLAHSRNSNRLAAICQWEQVALANLAPALRRVRSHPSYKRRSLEASIVEYGILNPIAINSNGVIVDGHLRVEIAQSLGLQTVPVIRIEHMSDAELRAYAVAANKMPAVANYDVDALRLEFEEIRAEVPGLDLTITGFTIGEIDRIEGNHKAGLYDDLDDDGSDNDVAAPPTARRGQLYALGEHRLICGDSLDAGTVALLMDGAIARAAFLDPPYNVKINGHVSGSGTHSEFAMASGEMSRDAFIGFLNSAFQNLTAHLLDGAITFVCMDHAHIGELIEAGDAVFSQRLNICCWDKGRGGMGALYRSQHELVAVFKHGTQPHLNNVALGKNGRNRTNVWSFPGMAGFGKGRKKALALHPTVKPVALVAEALLDVTGPGDIVIDLFGGSGTTLIAAERLGRAARLVEFDPLYVDRIIARWEKMTGQTAILLSDGASVDDAMLAQEPTPPCKQVME